MSLSTLDASGNLVSKPVDGRLEDILWWTLITSAVRELGLALGGTVIVLLGPMFLGMKIAKVAVEEDLLSQVSYLSLRQPLSSLDSYAEAEVIESSKPASLKEMWFTKRDLSVDFKPDVYAYTFDEDVPVYMLQDFNSRTALYLPQQFDNQSPRLLVIANDAIVSIELRSVKPDS
jgi:hypothetical protein